jgi:hypothetical protein
LQETLNVIRHLSYAVLLDRSPAKRNLLVKSEYDGEIQVGTPKRKTEPAGVFWPLMNEYSVTDLLQVVKPSRTAAEIVSIILKARMPGEVSLEKLLVITKRSEARLAT